ncbi:Crp/Fnr family transcriptional regulator [Muricoccus radiodurans]|uniref:Crp/Fnr family transcriptional regulator n=1 Tax=Muricoccus radiodurans TaxID=2231721 RepID=UPI003CEF7FDA
MSHVSTAPDGRRLLLRLESIADLTAEERQAVLDLPLVVRSYDAGSDIVRDHDRPHECCLLLEGYAIRHKLLPDGRRQIMAFHIPGDIPDLESLHLHILDNSVGALTPVRAAFIPHRAIREATQRHPGLLHAFWRQTLIDAAVFREWMIGMGRRTAHERIAHLICEMLLRLEAVGLAPEGTYLFPATQNELGDALGLSTVHVNRVLQDLRKQELITWVRSVVTVLKRDALMDLCAFDPTYLHQDHGTER